MNTETERVASLEVTSDAFQNGESIPRRFTCDGDDISPPLRWRGAPDGTRSFALICKDPDAPNGTFYHWGLYNLPPSITETPERYIPRDKGHIRQAFNDFQERRYGGPCPPPGHGRHRYFFAVYALDVEVLELPERTTCRELEDSVGPHTLGKGDIMGIYER